MNIDPIEKKMFRERLLRAINLAKIELEDRKSGIEGESTIEQLESVVLPELNDILRMIDNNLPLPWENRYLYSFACAFKVWGWDMQRPTALYSALTVLNKSYKKL